jgi:acyl dehydratase
MTPVVLDSLESLRQFVGKEIAVSDWMAITPERIRQFAEATEDRQWIHVDEERARRESPYGATIAHGFLTLSLLGYLLKQTITLPRDLRWTVNYGLNRVRFPAPVRAGARIRARVALVALKKLPDCTEAVFGMTVEVEGSEKPCCVAEWILLYYK